MALYGNLTVLFMFEKAVCGLMENSEDFVPTVREVICLILF